MFDKPEFLYCYNGGVYTAKKLAEVEGIDKELFLTRMRRGDFTVEQAVLLGKGQVTYGFKKEDQT